MTSGLKVILAMAIAVHLVSSIKSKHLVRSIVFFPNLVSTVAVGITFKSLMHPTRGLFNTLLAAIGIEGPYWLGNPDLALFSVIGTDVWKGLSIATVIYIAGLQTIPETYYEAAAIDGVSKWQRFRFITLPLVRSSMNSVIILSFIGGVRSFEMIWTMTGGGPGFATDTLASIIYKQYASGYFGLSTAGNVIMFFLIVILVFPLYRFIISREVEF
jgi:raffinose/stachyose/melibiose transport system permease protein